MTSLPTVALLAGLAMGLGFQPAATHAQEKVEGKVTRTNLTLCQPKPTGGGCEGTLTLEARSDGKEQQVVIKVTFDTIIRKGQDYVLLPATRGSSVVVSYVTEKGERVAKTIDVVGATR